MKTLKALVVSLLAVAFSLEAAPTTKLSPDLFAPLKARPTDGAIELSDLPLLGPGPSTVLLEEFAVWAAGGKVIVHGPEGNLTLDPPPMRFFRGSVAGEPDSLAYFSVDDKGRVQGLIVVDDRKFLVHGRPRPQVPALRPSEVEEPFDYVVSQESPAEVTRKGVRKAWTCGVEESQLDLSILHRSERVTEGSGETITPQSISGTQHYAIQVEVETDYELYLSAGSNVANLATYVTNLTGAVSTIYNRDILTNVTLGNVHIYTSTSAGCPGCPGGTYPWTATPSSGLDAAFYQVGDVYHQYYSSVSRSAVVLLSNKAFWGGEAWEGVVCQPDVLWGGHWAAGYAFVGSVNYAATVPDPNASQNEQSGSVQYGMPIGMDAYWPLGAYAHELGHVMGGHHTHCIVLTPAEQTATGRSYVDLCYGSEGGCYSGGTSAPPEKGTIMSYCHNIFDGLGYPQSRYLFGKASEVSHHELDDYLLRPGGPVASNYNIVNTNSITMSAFSAPASVAPSSAGNVASITAISGATYQWGIINGSITAGATTNSVTFTAGASGSVTLRATAMNGSSCGVTDTIAIPITASLLDAPTGVVATATSATSVGISWNAVSGAVTYDVYRTANVASAYSKVGSSATTSYTDISASSGTAYLYVVKAVDGALNASPASSSDLATTVLFTDPTITVGSTVAKAVHVSELRTAVNAVRTLANLAASSYTDPTLTAGTTVIKAIHVTELRTALNTARSALGLTSLGYTDPVLSSASTIIKAAHINDLRVGVR